MSVNVTEAASAGSAAGRSAAPQRAHPQDAPCAASGTPAPPQLGRYVLLERIGAGTMGEVWKASDPRIGRVVAIKLLRCPEGFDDARREEWERRFLLEARAAGRLAHPGIVAIHDVGQADDGRPFIVMEYVEGRSLDEYLKKGVRPDPERVLDWAAQVADALDHAHRQGIVHRDVKPANILVDPDGRARLADFGIARLSDSELTRDGAFLGSPAYAAPEQIRGLPLDGRADLFSLGAVTYALLTGSRPFRGDDLPSLAYAICHVEPAPPNRVTPGLSDAIQAVVLKALSKDRERRCRFGSEMADELRAAAAAPPGGAPSERKGGKAAGEAVERTVVDHAPSWKRAVAPPTWSTAKSWLRTCPAAIARRPLLALGVALAACAVAAATYLLATRFEGDSRPSPSPAARARTFFHETVLRENVGLRVSHGLEAGQITIWSDDTVVKSKALETEKKKVAVAGRSLLSYGRDTVEATLRLPAGSHVVTVAVASRDGKVNLVRKLAVEVSADERYSLDISVRSWPRPKLDVAWRRAAAREAS